VNLAAEGVDPVGHRLQVGARSAADRVQSAVSARPAPVGARRPPIEARHPAAGARRPAVAGDPEPQLPVPRSQTSARLAPVAPATMAAIVGSRLSVA
jgi:hypothetical protein